jgi:signal transduction histidine kinase
MNFKPRGATRVTILVIMIGGILSLHYFTLPEKAYHHAVYRMLFYLPLILGGFWFGLKGALSVCMAVFILYFPFLMFHWQAFSAELFDKSLEGCLYIVVAVVLGLLVERERAEHKARMETERLAAVGKTVSEIAHDMKTPLMAIGGFARQAARGLDADDPNKTKLGIVVKETGRLESMVKEMLYFGKPLVLQRSEADLNTVVLDSLEMSEPLAKEAGVLLAAHPDASLPAMFVDVRRMKQVMLNLISNAIQASPSGEGVSVTTTMRNGAVTLAVSDSGVGIKEEDRENIFLPFFSSKKTGTGLGLPIVKKIVEAHGGTINFYPNPERGVTFKISLPLSPGQGRGQVSPFF